MTWAQRSTHNETWFVPEVVRHTRGETQVVGSHRQAPLLQRLPAGQLVLAQGSGLQTEFKQVVLPVQGLAPLPQVERQTPTWEPWAWTQT